MSNLKIQGRIKLSGEVTVAGNKNAALPCLAAALLLPPAPSPVRLTIKNLPQIRDARLFIDILKTFGLSFNKNDPDKIVISNTSFCPNPNQDFSLPPEEARKFRGTILLLGPLLRFFRQVVIPQVGGCKIGPRPVDTHLGVFSALGIDVTSQNENIYTLEHNQAKEKTGDLTVWLKEASVTATENLLLYLGVNPKIKNEITIVNAACEPHVQMLCALLKKMGTPIKGAGTNVLEIEPGEFRPRSLVVDLEPDYIEALTYAIAAALTKSDLTIHRVTPEHLMLINWYLKRMGVYTRFTQGQKGDFCWKIYGQNSHLAIHPSLKDIKAEPWPGLPTDALPLFIILATQCQGEVEFVDYMYNGRLSRLINALQLMGASIWPTGSHGHARGALVKGPAPLTGHCQLGPDLRSGAGLVLAGLVAEGETVIEEFEVIERGYDNLTEKLLALGAKVEKS